MKTIITTIAATLLSTSVFASDALYSEGSYDIPSATDISINSIRQASSPDTSNLFLEGNFVQVEIDNTQVPELVLDQNDTTAAVYIEGNFDV